MLLTLLCALSKPAAAEPSQQYWDVGASLGTPGGLNATGAYWTGHFGARAMLGYGAYMSGASLTGLYRFNDVRPRKASHSVGLSWGHTEIADSHTTWIGPVYELDVSWGLYLQTGLSISARGATPVLPLFSMGYVRRLHR